MTEGDTFEANSYWENRLRENPTIKGVGFFSLAASFNTWMYRVRKPVFDAVVRKYGLANPSSKVLDAGSGTGFYIERWRSLGAVGVQGLDLTRASADMLAQRFPDVPFHVADIGDPDALLKLAIAPESLDAVSCMDVLFHIVDDERFDAALHNIADLLRPGGIFILSDNFVHGEAIRLSHHVSRSLDTYLECLAVHGFEVLERRPMFIHMNAPVDDPDQTRQVRWMRMMERFARTELRGRVTGLAMYPLERFLVAIRKESPTTEIMVCRKSVKS